MKSSMKRIMAKKNRMKDMLGLHKVIDLQDKPRARKYSRKVIQSVAHEYMVEFWLRRDYLAGEYDPDPDPPWDDDGSAIDYPSGRGGGKDAIVDWLLKYNQKSNLKMLTK